MGSRAALRIRVDPLDVPAEAAARRLGLTVAEFDDKLPRLLSRGFPAADPDTGKFALDAIDAWRRKRHPLLFASPALTASEPMPEARADIERRIKAMRGSGG
jgi:hypothetical protein